MDSFSNTRLYLNDLSVGEFYVSGKFRLDADQIKTFAQQFDPQPFYMDEQAAQDSVFLGLAASGWQTAAITMKLLSDSIPLENAIIGGGKDITWPNPTRPGDELQVVSEIISIIPSESKPDRGMVTIRSETFNQRGQLLQHLLAKLIVFRRG
jgi:acyl dehydratase